MDEPPTVSKSIIQNLGFVSVSKDYAVLIVVSIVLTICLAPKFESATETIVFKYILKGFSLFICREAVSRQETCPIKKTWMI